MPEMPEVETIARTLRRTIIGKTVASVRLSGLPLRRPVEESFASDLIGRTIRRIHRRGKYLVAEMEPRAYWLIHLGMSGRVFYFASRPETPRHTHARIGFADSSELQYRDHRRFGLLAVHRVARMALIPELKRIGRDPLSRCLTAAWLQPFLSACRQEIKAFLLDQRKIAGLGNIYVCEALFRARIHPKRRCNTLALEETDALVRAIRKTIRLAVRRRGTSFSDFMDSDGELGDNQYFLRVFQLDGKRCRRCRTVIERLRQGNRSSYFCPRCQR
jgi:formamidopyrimidine-DNA glycosylase